MRAWTLLILLCVSASPMVKWSRAGEFGQVSIGPDSRIVLNAKEGSVAGAVSSEFDVTGDFVLVHADISNAPARGVTIAVQDGKSDDSIGYWQNPLAITGPLSVDAAIQLSDHAKLARLFVGSDREPSKAVLANVTWKCSTKAAFAHGSAYGSLVDSQHVAGQTFVASKGRLDAVVVRIRQLNDATGPSLRVRLARWDKRETVLAEARVSRDLVPSPKQHDEIELCIPLSAAMKRGERYYIEFSTAEACTKEQAFLLYAGDDSYPNGTRYENESAAANWDLYFETLESD